MTFVTTSRKALPEIRSLAKDFAFAAGCDYNIRGKSGLVSLNSQDSSFFVFSAEYQGIRLQLFSGGVPVLDYLVLHQVAGERAGTVRNGIFTGDQSVYDSLRPYVPVVLSDGVSGCLSFDGTHRRRYVLRLMPYGT